MTENRNVKIGHILTDLKIGTFSNSGVGLVQVKNEGQRTNHKLLRNNFFLSILQGVPIENCRKIVELNRCNFDPIFGKPKCA